MGGGTGEGDDGGGGDGGGCDGGNGRWPPLTRATDTCSFTLHLTLVGRTLCGDGELSTVAV